MAGVIGALAGCTSSLSGGGGGEYPSESLEMVVPHGSGGGTDIYAQAIADYLGDELGVEVTRTHRPGARTQVGATYLHEESKGDHAMLISHLPTLIMTQIGTEDVVYDVSTWKPLTAFTYEALVPVQNPNQATDSMPEVISKYQSGELTTFGGPQPGSPMSMAAWLAKDRWGLDFDEYVAYGGGGELLNATLNGETDVTIPGMVPTAPHVVEGNVHPVMQWTEEDPHPATPDGANIPTIADVGLETLDGMGTFTRVIYGHPDMTEEQQSILEEALLNVLNSDEAQQWAEESNNPLNPRGADAVQAEAEAAYAIEDDIRAFTEDPEGLLNS